MLHPLDGRPLAVVRLMNSRWARADYPSKTWLSEPEAMDVLRHGADPAWFEPAYQRSAIIAEHRPSRFGLIRVYGDPAASEAHDVKWCEDREELSWALESEWSDLTPSTSGGEPRLPYDVYFFTPDVPLRLHLVIEADGEDD